MTMIADNTFSIDRWLPEKFRVLEDQEVALRARIFLALLLACILPLLFFSWAFVALSILGVMDLWLPTSILMGTAMGQIFCWMYFQRAHDLATATFIYAFLIVALVSTVIYYTGGWHSPVCILFLALPVIIGLVVNRGVGIFFSFSVLLIYTYLFYLSENDFIFQQLIPESLLTYISAGLWALTLLMILGGLLLYERSTNKLAEAVETDRNQLEWEASYDALTGVFNEQALFERLETCMERAIGENSGSLEPEFEYGLIYIEVENLSDVTSRFGFEAGETFLKTIAESIQGSLSEEGVCARYASNRFLALVEDIDNSGAFLSIVSRLKNLHQSVVGLNETLYVKAFLKVGAVLASDEEVSRDDLLDTARANATTNSQLMFTRV